MKNPGRRITEEYEPSVAKPSSARERAEDDWLVAKGAGAPRKPKERPTDQAGQPLSALRLTGDRSYSLGCCGSNAALCLAPLGNEGREIGNPTAVSPFVIVPGEHFSHFLVQDHGR